MLVLYSGSLTDIYLEESSCECSHLPSTAAYPVQPMLPLSAGCGWHCVLFPVAHQYCSRCWAPRCSGAVVVSPAAAPQHGSTPPLRCPPHNVEKTSYFKCGGKNGWFIKKEDMKIPHCLYMRWNKFFGMNHHAGKIWCLLTVAMNLLC